MKNHSGDWHRNKDSNIAKSITKKQIVVETLLRNNTFGDFGKSFTAEISLENEN